MRFSSFPVILMLLVAPFFAQTATGQIDVGSGAKAGEITHDRAIVHVRLTSTEGQDENGLIPGAAGEARVIYSTDEKLQSSKETGWRKNDPETDFAIPFHLTNLEPGQRWYYQIEFREQAGKPSKKSERYSFVTAPAPASRAAVHFHLTTCQDTRGESTYVAMESQHPDFCISAGDTVYYDKEGDARTVPAAFQAYQKMFGLPAMKRYYRDIGSYFLKDDHDYRFNDADPYMKGRWVSLTQSLPGARYTETKDDRKLDEAWLTHEEGMRVFKLVFPMSEKPYRTFRWGKGIQLWLLENRDYRSPNDMPDGPEKSIWGAAQKKWLKETLLASDADFRIIISPNPIIGPDRMMKGDNHANLNGFWHEGQSFLDWVRDEKLSNLILMCGDRHWQYHSIDTRSNRRIHEFSVGPTCDEHTQDVPPGIDGVERPYSAKRGGFMSISYQPDQSVTFRFFSTKGEPLYEYRVESMK